MTDHPYALPDTMVPGEVADDDPFAEEQFCEKCDEYVEPVAETCPICGQDVM
jgi:hypothetical protein